MRALGILYPAVAVRLTYADGSTSIRNTYFVFEDGSWKHRFSQEEYDLPMPDLSYEEFIAAQHQPANARTVRPVSQGRRPVYALYNAILKGFIFQNTLTG